MRKHLILDIVFQRLAILGYLITEMNVIWSHWGTLYKVEMYRIGPLRPPSPSLHPFHLHYLSIDCDAQDQNISEEYNTIKKEHQHCIPIELYLLHLHIHFYTHVYQNMSILIM